MRALLARFRRNGRGTAAMEFAFVLPVMLLFVTGIVEFGRAYVSYFTVNSLATRYAIAYADCYDYPALSCNTELSTYSSQYSIGNLAPQLTNTPVSLRMFEVVMSSSSPATATIVYPVGSTATLTANELAQAQTAIGAGQTGVVVTVSYQHTLIFFAKLMSPFLGSSRTVIYTVAQRKT